MPGRSAARLIYKAAVKAVSPAQLMREHIRLSGTELIVANQVININNINKIYIIGAGKASAAMAAAVEKILGDRISEGFIVTSYGNGFPLKYIKLLEAGHPLPDHNSLVATAEIKALAEKATANDLIIFLLSGGASALMADYPEGSSLEELQELFNRLLISGATIQKINIVRKHLSAVKGGKLAQLAFPAPIFTLAISDVIGDDPSFIGSGPTVIDKTSIGDMINVLKKYQLDNHLPQGINSFIFQLQKKSFSKNINKVSSKNYYTIIGNNRLALEAAAKEAGKLGYKPVVLKTYLQGEAKLAGQHFASQLKNVHKNTCLLQGGETTVTVMGKGTGGRNQELALSALLNLPEQATILAAGTDGIDGPTTAAGAFADKLVRKAAKRLHLNINTFLEANDSWHFFEQTDGLFITGPTGTNVMDIVIGLME